VRKIFLLEKENIEFLFARNKHTKVAVVNINFLNNKIDMETIAS
jgi:hypothetical protein